MKGLTICFTDTSYRRETGEIMTESLQFVFLELTNCKKALTPQATLLDNLCYALHNIEHLTDRPDELKEEIFKRLFKTAEIATFTSEERITIWRRCFFCEADLRHAIR